MYKLIKTHNFSFWDIIHWHFANLLFSLNIFHLDITIGTKGYLSNNTAHHIQNNLNYFNCYDDLGLLEQQQGTAQQKNMQSMIKQMRADT